ncbi:MAG TPA: cbb3-type cytochrome c oxidase subunit I, partial [Methylophilaceae bacterium]|nr:cbb3-type cytochrome c oxidase subunit I [Methylophilaceae bacterium]
MAVDSNPLSQPENVVDDATRRDSVIDHSKVRVNVAAAARLDRSSRFPVLLGFALSIIWLLEGTLLGDIASFKFDWPDFLGSQEYLTFGRVRPAHLNAMVYGWASTAMFATSLWMMPRLCRTPLRWPGLAVGGIIVWNIGVFIGIILLLAGVTDGLEWLEMDNTMADPLLVIGAAMVGASIWKTLADRKVEHLYVSIWYVAASYPWFAIIFIAGNLPIYSGIESGAINWFYAHNALGLWLTTVNLGLIYYLLPKIVGRPIYSYWLSL